MLASLPHQPLEQLLRIAEALVSATAPDDVLRCATQAALDLFEADACSLSLYDPASQELLFFISDGPARVAPFRMPVTQGIAGHVFRTGEPFASNDVTSDKRFAKHVDKKSGHTTRSMLCHPLGRRGERIGTIQVLNTRKPGGFDERDGQLLAILGSMAGTTLDRTRTERAVRNSHDVLREEVQDRYTLIQGESQRMSLALSTLERAARSQATVLLLGESGVGKEVAARAVHRWSERADRPFVVVNCAALSPALLESELFGHERGAFTGAVGRKPGRFELADGGTLFLDEVGELAPDLQAKLLRVLQDGEIMRVGGTQTLKTDVRVLAATNRDLSQCVKDGCFRLDLYYRLNVISLTLPPLRERRADIPALAEHFLRRSAREQNRPITKLSDAALECLRSYDWPGNVRELANVIERAVVLCAGTSVELDDLPLELQDAVPAPREPIAPRELSEVPDAPLAEALAAYKRHVIATTLARCEGNQMKAASRLGLHPSNLSRAIKRLGLR
jgi:Nif-specific regulatory protein